MGKDKLAKEQEAKEKKELEKQQKLKDKLAKEQEAKEKKEQEQLQKQLKQEQQRLEKEKKAQEKKLKEEQAKEKKLQEKLEKQREKEALNEHKKQQKEIEKAEDQSLMAVDVSEDSGQTDLAVEDDTNLQHEQKTNGADAQNNEPKATEPSVIKRGVPKNTKPAPPVVAIKMADLLGDCNEDKPNDVDNEPDEQEQQLQDQ